MKTSLMHVLSLSLVSVFAVSACSQGSSINLQNPANPSGPAPTAPNGKPGDGTGNSDGGNASQPAPTPTPVPQKARVRLYCEANITSTGLGTVTSRSHLSTIPEDIHITYPKGTQISQYQANQLLPVAVKFDLIDQARALFQSPNGHLYLANINTLMNTADAVLMGSVPSISASASSLASRLGISLRSYGASTEGTYLLIPTGAALDVRDAGTGKSVGKLAFNSSTTFYPALDETTGLFSALSYSGSGFKPVFAKLSISAGSVTLVNTIAAPSVAGGKTATQPLVFSADSYAWSEVSSGAALASSIDLVVFAPLTNTLIRKTFSGDAVQGLKLSPRIAVVGALASETLIAVAEEDFVRKGGVQPTNSKIAMLHLDASGLSERFSYQYPASVYTQIHDYGLATPFAAVNMFGVAGSDNLFISMTTLFGLELYRGSGGGLDNLINDNCTNPSGVEEKP